MWRRHSFAASMISGSNWFASWQDRRPIRISRVLAPSEDAGGQVNRSSGNHLATVYGLRAQMSL